MIFARLGDTSFEQVVFVNAADSTDQAMVLCRSRSKQQAGATPGPRSQSRWIEAHQGQRRRV
jgi:hypothetical protein